MPFRIWRASPTEAARLSLAALAQWGRNLQRQSLFLLPLVLAPDDAAYPATLNRQYRCSVPQNWGTDEYSRSGSPSPALRYAALPFDRPTGSKPAEDAFLDALRNQRAG